MPCESDNESIDKCEKEKPKGISETESIDLVEDKTTEYNYSSWIKWELFSEESYQENHLYDTVTQEIKRSKVLSADRKILNRVHEIIRYQILIISDQFILCNTRHKTYKEILCNKVGSNSSDYFCKCDDTFPDKTDIKYQM